jgi:hypothetical protein
VVQRKKAAGCRWRPASGSAGPARHRQAYTSENPPLSTPSGPGRGSFVMADGEEEDDRPVVSGMPTSHPLTAEPAAAQAGGAIMRSRDEFECEKVHGSTLVMRCFSPCPAQGFATDSAAVVQGRSCAAAPPPLAAPGARPGASTR